MTPIGLSRVAKRPAFQKAFADARNFQQQVPERAQALGKFSG